MWRTRAVVIVVLAAAVACSRAPEARRYEVRGQILAVDRERREVLVDHEDVAGSMPLTATGHAPLKKPPAGPLITDTDLLNAYSGNMWTPAELIADLRQTPAPAH